MIKFISTHLHQHLGEYLQLPLHPVQPLLKAVGVRALEGDGGQEGEKSDCKQEAALGPDRPKAVKDATNLSSTIA